jgi:hypothetical protein
MAENYTDLTIRWNGHQKYVEGKIIENDPIEVIVQKLEMILFTNREEIFGQEGGDIGANLEYFLWETSVANEIIKGEIVQQINKYIPELIIMGYELDIVLFNGAIRDIMNINFKILGYNVNFIFQ